MRTRRVFFGIVALIALFLTLASGFYVMSTLFTVLVLSVLLSWLWTRASMRGITSGATDRPALAQVGEWVEEKVWLQNTSLLPRPWIHVEDLGTVPGLPSEVMGVPGRGTQSWTSLATRTTSRGRFEWGPLRLSASDPLGLFQTHRIVGGTEGMVVYPAPVPLSEFVLSSSEESGDAPEYRATSQFTPNVVSVRRYSIGDSLNRIHWPSSAKLARLMVKEFETEVQSDLWILLDLNRDAQIGAGADGTEEVGVTVAASIARYLLGYDNGVGFMAVGDAEYAIPSGTGDPHLWRILEALALCQATGRNPLRSILSAQAPRFSSHMGIIAITPSVEDALSVGSFLMERNAPGAVVLLEPTSFGAQTDDLPALSTLLATGIAVYVVRRGDDLGHALSFAALGPVAGQPGARRGFMTPERWGA